MLRYIYLLCFIISFEFVFCYNYINSQANHRRIRPRVDRLVRHRPVESRLRKRHNFGSEDSPLTQIDVVSFMQKDDEDEEHEPSAYRRSKKRRLKPDDYPSAENGDRYLAPRDSRETQEFNQLDIPLPDYTLNSYQKMQLDNRQLMRDPKCKSSFLKTFPFFSHNKSGTIHPKGTKKKKLNHSKTSKKVNELTTVTTSVNFSPKIKHSREKTSGKDNIFQRYAECICPKCKMKYRKLRKRRNVSNVIHNSRQYFAKLKLSKGQDESDLLTKNALLDNSRNDLQKDEKVESDSKKSFFSNSEERQKKMSTENG